MYTNYFMLKLLVCGSINWDTIIFVDEFPKSGEEVKANNVMSLAGGKGGNTAVAAAKIINGVGIIGVLGYDEIADKHLSTFTKDGIDTSLIFRKDTQSGQAYIIIDKNGENIIYTYKRANFMLDINDIEMISDRINDAEIVIVIDPLLEVAERLIDLAYERGKKVIFMPALLTKHGLDKLEDSLMRADFVILNEHEAMNLTNNNAIVSSKILSNKFGKIIVTRGNKGCIFAHNDKQIFVPTMDLSLFNMKSISSVGAGDTFTGVFSALLLKGYSEIESIFAANIAAALKTTRYGARDSPTYDEIRRYLTDHRVKSIYKEIKFT